MGVKQHAQWCLVFGCVFIGWKQIGGGKPPVHLHFNQLWAELDFKQSANQHLGRCCVFGRWKQIGGGGLQRPDLYCPARSTLFKRVPFRNQSHHFLVHRDWLPIAAEFQFGRHYLDKCFEFGVSHKRSESGGRSSNQPPNFLPTAKPVIHNLLFEPDE